MEDKEKNQDVLTKIYRNANIALQSISDIMPEIEDIPVKTELQTQYEGYEKIIGEISTVMAEYGVEPKELGVMKKTMMWSSIKMKTFADDSQNNISDMMLQGTIMGISELLTILSENKGVLSESVEQVVQKLLDLEESYEENLKKFL